MCKLGFISLRGRFDITKLVMLGTCHYGYINDDGIGISFLDKNELKVVKSEEKATRFWLNYNDKIITDNAIIHVRSATNGSVKLENTHPFISEDGKYALVHNGVLSGYEDLKKYLIEKGHIFSSETDSEVILHAFEEFGQDNFIKKMEEHKTRGSMTILILSKDKIFAYTNSESLEMFRHKDGIYGFTDDSFMKSKHKITVKDGKLYIIQNGVIISRKNIGKLDKYEYSSGVGSYTADHGTIKCENEFQRVVGLSNMIEEHMSKRFGIEYAKINVLYRKYLAKVETTKGAKEENLIALKNVIGGSITKEGIFIQVLKDRRLMDRLGITEAVKENADYKKYREEMKEEHETEQLEKEIEQIEEMEREDRVDRCRIFENDRIQDMQDDFGYKAKGGKLMMARCPSCYSIYQDVSIEECLVCGCRDFELVSVPN